MTSPWFSILTEPKKTIRSIVDQNPNYGLLILSIIYGFCAFLGFAQLLRLGEKLSIISILIPAIILAPIMGYILFTFCSWLVFFTGKLIKGVAPFKHIRAAIAWSNVPLIVNALTWILLIIIFDKKIVEDFSTKEILSTPSIVLLLGVKFVQMIASIWSLVIYINALAEVQSFSILRAILNVILSMILGFLIVFLLSLALSGPCSYFFNEPVIALEIF
jgi:hypothetical protein